jgi:hypothetical protein
VEEQASVEADVSAGPIDDPGMTGDERADRCWRV